MFRNLATKALLHGTRTLVTTSASSSAARAVVVSNKSTTPVLASIVTSPLYAEKSFTSSPSKRQFSSDESAATPPPPPTGEKIKGVVKWFDKKKGYGFIIPSDGSDNLFVHHTDIANIEGFRFLTENEEVEFVEGGDAGKRMAKDVTVLPGPPMNADGTKHLGLVKWFDPKKGYGFVTPNDGSEDIFVHYTDVHCEGFAFLRDRETVEFNVEINDQNGQRIAKDVTGPGGEYCTSRPPRQQNFDDGYGGHDHDYSQDSGYGNNKDGFY